VNSAASISLETGTFTTDASVSTDYRLYDIAYYFSVDHSLSDEDIEFYSAQCGETGGVNCDYAPAFSCRFSVTDDPLGDPLEAVYLGCESDTDVEVTEQFGTSIPRVAYVIVRACLSSAEVCDNQPLAAVFVQAATTP
jgi:hypothetical protein